MKWLQATLLIFPTVLLSPQRPYRKLDYTIDTENEDQIDNQEGFPHQPTFSAAPVSFNYGGIFSISDLSGNPLPSGYQDVLSMQCAIGDLNAITKKNGQNTTFYYNIYNDQTNPAAAVRAATLLFTAGVPVIIGPTESDAATSVASLYASFNETIISGSASAVGLSDSSVFGSFFRTIPSDQNAAIAIADMMLYFNWTLVTPIYSRDTYGLSGQQEFTSAAIARNILLTCGRVLPPGQLTGLQSTIDCLTRSQSTVVLLWMQARDAAAVISAFYNSTVLPDITFVGPDSWGDSYDLNAYADANFPASYLEGTLGVVPRKGDQSQYVQCIANLTAQDNTIPGFLDYWETSLRCLPTNDTKIEVCTENVLDRPPFPDISCRCREEDNLSLVNSTHKVNYIYDAIFAAYNALDQINNNCTGVSEATGEDFCGRDEFTTSDLQKVVGIAEFEGRTGLVAFNGNDPISNSILQFKD